MRGKNVKPTLCELFLAASVSPLCPLSFWQCSPRGGRRTHQRVSSRLQSLPAPRSAERSGARSTSRQTVASQFSRALLQLSLRQFSLPGSFPFYCRSVWVNLQEEERKRPSSCQKKTFWFSGKWAQRHLALQLHFCRSAPASLLPTPTTCPSPSLKKQSK